VSLVRATDDGSLWIAGGFGWVGYQPANDEKWQHVPLEGAPSLDEMTYGMSLPYTKLVVSRLKMVNDNALYAVGRGLWRRTSSGAAAAAAREIDDGRQLIDIVATSKGTLLTGGVADSLWRRAPNDDKWTRVPIEYGVPEKIGCIALVAIGDQILLFLNRTGSAGSPVLISNDDGLSFEPLLLVPEFAELKDHQFRTAIADGQGGALLSGSHGVLLRISPEGGLGPFGKKTAAAARKSAKAIQAENQNPSPPVQKKKDEAEEKRLLDEVIAASPDDDAPRLVYADWLIEHGDARGEFIQLQCLLAKGDPNTPGQPHPDQQSMLNRVGVLMKKHEKEWLAPIKQYFYSHVWSRGFLFTVTSNPKFFPGADKVFTTHPIVRLNIEGMKKKSDLDAFNDMPIGRSVRYLDVSSQRIGPDKVKVLLGERLANIEWLMLYANPLGDEGCQAIAAKSHLKKLKGLSLLSCGIGDAGIEALASSPVLESVERLNVRGNNFTNKGLEALIASPYLKHAYDVRVRHYREDEFDDALLAKLQARLKPGPADDRWEPY
jgi:uncharacterized protein (TIGR02996 family)